MAVRTKLVLWTLAGLFVPAALAMATWSALSRALYRQEEAFARRQARQIEQLLGSMQAELQEAAGRHPPLPGQARLEAAGDFPELALLLDGGGKVLASMGGDGEFPEGERPFDAHWRGLCGGGSWAGYHETPEDLWVLAAARCPTSATDDAQSRWLVFGRRLLGWLGEQKTAAGVHVEALCADGEFRSFGPTCLSSASFEGLPRDDQVHSIENLKLVRFLPLSDLDGRVRAHLAVVIERSWSRHMRLVGLMVAGSVLLIALALAGMLLVGIHAHVIRPLEDLQTRIDAVRLRHAPVDTLLQVDAPQEIRRVGQVIAELMEAQQAAERALTKSHALKSQFLANTSHELRTPLNAIVGFTQLILDELYADHEELVDFVSRAHRSALHLLGVVNDVLDLAKIEAGRGFLYFVLRMEALQVEEIFADIEQFFATKVTHKNIKLLFNRPAEPVAVMADRQRLRQVLFNVVGNALKFTEQGSITVGCEPGPQPGQCTFSVRDTGVGLRPEDCERVFDSFVQADGSTTRQHEGSGLGLTICRELLAGMGGEIRLHSDGPGTGCLVTFTVLLPGAAEPLHPALSLAPSTSDGHKTR